MENNVVLESMIICEFETKQSNCAILLFNKKLIDIVQGLHYFLGIFQHFLYKIDLTLHTKGIYLNYNFKYILCTLFSITKSPPTSGFLLMPVDSVLFPLLYFYSAFKLFARLVSNAAISGFPRTFIKRSASTPSGTATVFAV